MNKFILPTIKLIFLLLTGWYLFRRIYPHKDYFFSVCLEQAGRHSLWLPFLSLGLMFPNWWLETVKWKQALQKIRPTEMKQALLGVLSGISWGIFSPNRSGEFIGRLAFVPSGQRWEAMNLHLALSACQQLVTFAAGIVPAWYFFQHHPLHLPFFWISAGTLGVLGLLFLFRNSLLVFVQPLAAATRDVFSRLNKKDWILFLSLSVVRYLLFCVQFFFLLHFFGIPLSSAQAIPLIFLNFFLVSLIPSFALTEIGVRGAVALVVFQGLYVNPAQVISASLALWMINLGLPSLAGMAAFLNRKVD